MKTRTLIQAFSLTVLIAGLAAALLLCSMLLKRERAELQSRAETEAAQVAVRLSAGIQSNIAPLESLAAWWLSQGEPLDPEDWRTDAQLFLSRAAGLRRAAWIGGDGLQHWTAEPGAEPDTKTTQADDRIQALINTAPTRASIAMSDVFATSDIPAAVYVCSRIRTGRRIRGYVIGVYDTSALLSSVARNEIPPDRRISIRAGGREIYSNSRNLRARAQEQAHASLSLPNQVWTIVLGVPSNYFREFKGLIFAVASVFGALFYSFGMLLIISHRRASELQRANETLERLQRAERMESLGVMAAGIAHDFNNLLTSVIGEATIAMESLVDGTEARRHITSSLGAANDAAKLVHQLLAYTGHACYARRPIDIGEIITGMRPASLCAAGANVEVRTAIGSRLPRVIADPDEIRRVVNNLVLNATEALQSKHGTIEISVDTQELTGQKGELTLPDRGVAPGTYVRISVRDNGAGMSSEIAEKAFDPFFSTKFLGRGLGLSVVLGIVRAHNGAVRLKTAPNAGTAVEVLLPAAADNELSTPAAVRSLPGWPIQGGSDRSGSSHESIGGAAIRSFASEWKKLRVRVVWRT